MTLARLQLYGFLGLALLVTLLAVSRYSVAHVGGTRPIQLVVEALVVAGAVAFFAVLIHYFRRLQDELVRRNRELLMLHAAAQDVHRVLDLDLLLQRVVDEARDLVRAEYGALSVVDDDGGIQVFHTSGLSAEMRERIGEPPRGRGLLGVPLREGQILRLPNIGQDPRSAGFPPNHPPMKSLLAVPVECRGPFRGNLYLSDRIDRREFTEGDAETLQRFATQVGIAIDNQFLNRRLRDLAVAEERARISRDLHDGTAQVLAYVNAKAQAVREHLVAGNGAAAATQLDQLAAAAREVYSEVRKGIVTLREAAQQERSFAEELRALATSWASESGVELDLELDEALALQPEVEIQLLRVAGEALNNVRRHAGARRVRVRLAREDERVRLEIEDDGVGFDPQAPPPAPLPRFGLRSMQERVELVGGHLQLDSRNGGPTRVSVDLPVRALRVTKGVAG